MNTLTAALNAEIRRLARKELRQEVEPLKKAVASYKSRLRDITQEVAELRRQLAKQGRTAARGNAALVDNQPEESGTHLRWRPAGLATHRKRLGLSAANAAAIIGVSPLTVYNWESGKTRPRNSQMPAIDKLRKMGRREAAAALEAVAAS